MPRDLDMLGHVFISLVFCFVRIIRRLKSVGKPQVI